MQKFKKIMKLYDLRNKCLRRWPEGQRLMSSERSKIKLMKRIDRFDCWRRWFEEWRENWRFEMLTLRNFRIDIIGLSLMNQSWLINEFHMQVLMIHQIESSRKLLQSITICLMKILQIMNLNESNSNSLQSRQKI